ncbi:MAG TPA: hypothetical protein VFV80_03315, partial [Geminicoccaceae bacterium]|nr:hypothetical protein [Geminicoccaceae bacterium]
PVPAARTAPDGRFQARTAAGSDLGNRQVSSPFSQQPGMSRGGAGTVNGRRPESYWNARVDETAYSRLEADLTVNVALISGGMAGATAAMLLNLAAAGGMT